MPAGAKASQARVFVEGRDVTSAFAVRANGRFMGLVTGLAQGPNRLSVEVPGLGGQQIVIENHPIGGPVFSGPQIQPWTCFDGAEDGKCNREPVVEYFYKPEGAPGGGSALGQNVGGGFEPYDPDNPPDDVAMTTTDEGHTVPYIVRVETGAINRDEYRFAVLYNPGEDWQPWAPQEAFNQKLVITHGASCNTEYQQGSAPDVMNDTALSRGFAVMSHALNNSGHNCNVVTQAESMIMLKEYLIERLGELRYTIGSGCSGGALAQYQVANAYPGLYQGITPACSFPDTWTQRMLYEDYSLLRRYFENPASWEVGVAWAYDDIAAVLGHPNYVNTIVYNTAIAPLQDPSRSCPGVDAADVYDPATNPDGVRCTLADYMVNIFGSDPETGFARRPWDTVGVMYGLKALDAGLLTPAQFADVNLKVGGRDIDYQWIPERTQGDVLAMARAHRSGAFNIATNLDQVAIIDLRGPDPGAFHDVYRTYNLRARLERNFGHADNMALWQGMVPLFGDPAYADEAILAMDEWLAAVEADDRDVPLAQKIVENRTVSHRCTNGAGTEIDFSVCDDVVESYSSARIEAGMPFTDDVGKCQLKPLETSDFFPVRFTEEEWAKLEAAFPEGVCDYGKPAVGFEPTVPWLTFENGPGGEPLGAPPVSRAVN